MKTLAELRDQYGTEEVWAWPEAYPHLFDLVATGSKRATSAYFPKYDVQQQGLPMVGSYHILLDSIQVPRRALVLKWTEVRIYPFNQVAADVPPAEHLSDQQWREGYQKLFSKEALQLGRSFSTDDRVVTRFFTVIEELDLVK